MEVMAIRNGGYGGAAIGKDECWAIFLRFFKTNDTFYAYFGQNSSFETITYQLKAFEKQSKRTK